MPEIIGISIAGLLLGVVCFLMWSMCYLSRKADETIHKAMEEKEDEG